jgi:hypothetical protein
MSFYLYKTGSIDEWLAACRSGLAALTGNWRTTGPLVAVRVVRWKYHIECQRQFPSLAFAPITFWVDVVFRSDFYFSWSGLGFFMNSPILFVIRLPQFVTQNPAGSIPKSRESYPPVVLLPTNE